VKTAFLRKIAIIAMISSFCGGCNFIRIYQCFQGRIYERSGLNRNTITLNDVTVSLWEGGTGPNLLLLHGFGGDATLGWADQLPYFSKHFHVIVPDLLWFGDSTSKNPATIEDQVHMVNELLKHLNVHSYDVLGISYGGLIANELALANKKQIHKVVLVDSPASSYTEADYRELLSRFGITNAHELLLPTDDAGLKRLYEAAYYHPPLRTKFGAKSVIKNLINTNRKQKLDLIDNLVSELRTIQDRTERISQDTLIIWGEFDPVFPLPIARRLKDELGDHAQIAIINNARHAPNLEYPEQFNVLVTNFLIPPSGAPLTHSH